MDGKATNSNFGQPLRNYRNLAILIGVRRFAIVLLMLNNSKRLKDFLKKKKFSLNQGSRLLNIDKYSLWRYTSGKRAPSKEIQKLMKKKLKFEWLEVKKNGPLSKKK